MRTFLLGVRSPAAAREIAIYADRLKVGGAVTTAVSSVELLAKLHERPVDVVLVDTTLIRADPVGFVRRALAFAPSAVMMLFGAESRTYTFAVNAAGARGVIGADQELVAAVAQAVLLLAVSMGGGAPAGVLAGGGAVEPASPAPAGLATTTEVAAAAGPGDATGSGSAAGAEANGGRAVAAERAVPRDITSAVAEGAAGAARHAEAVPEPAHVVGSAGLRDDDDRSALSATVVPSQRGDLPPSSGRTSLTERELQVLRAMADGKSNAEIGRDLFVSEDTVKTHARRLFRKLGARDRAHAVAAGFRAGLVS